MGSLQNFQWETVIAENIELAGLLFDATGMALPGGYAGNTVSMEHFQTIEEDYTSFKMVISKAFAALLKEQDRLSDDNTSIKKELSSCARIITLIQEQNDKKMETARSDIEQICAVVRYHEEQSNKELLALKRELNNILLLQNSK